MREVPLSALAQVNPTRPALQEIAMDSAVSFIPMSDVTESGEWEPRQTRRLRDVVVGYTAFAEGDVLFAKITPCMENGKGAHATGTVRGIGFGTTEFHVLRAKPNVDPRFVFHWTMSRPLRGKAESMMTGSAGQRRVPASFFDKFFVPELPSIEQREIAAILDTIDDAIRKTEQIITKLTQVRRGLLHDVLTRGIDDNGELRKPEHHPERFKESPLGMIPREWATCSLRELSNVVRGSTPRPAKDPRYFNGTCAPWITVGELSKDDWPYLTETTSMLTELGTRFSRRLAAGTVVISNSGYGCGVPKILALDGYGNDGIAAFLNLSPRCDPLFLYYFLFSQIQTLRTRVARGVDQPNLNTDLLGQFCVPVPQVQEQQALARMLFSVALRVRSEQAQVEKLRLVKAGLMEDLLTGRVRVAFPLLGAR